MTAAMARPTHMARVTGRITFVASDGREHTIPMGPCLIEERGGDLVDIVWGYAGEESTVLPNAAADMAEREGHLVLLD
jgi:hypothetical protein